MPEPEGKGAYVLSQLYYYAGAAIGVGFLLGGAIAALLGLKTMAIPREFESVRDGVRGLLFGLAFGLPGLTLAWTHLREARRREGGPFTAAFWGSSLYFHLIALIALGFVLTGVIGILGSLADLAVPHCVTGGFVGSEGVRGTTRDCYPTAAEAGRRILDFGIVLIVGGPVFWWHLRQGRRLTGGPVAEPD